MPFSASSGSVDPNRICLFDERVPFLATRVYEHGVLFFSHVSRRTFLIVEKKFLESMVGMSECRGMYETESTDVSDSRRAPSASLCEPLYAEACDFCVLAALFPSVDAARSELRSFVGVETSVDGFEHAEGDSMENDVGVARRADAYVCAGRTLHVVVGGEGGGRRERRAGRTTTSL